MKIFFISEDEGLVSYAKEKHFKKVIKFLFWNDGDGLLIAGGGFMSISHESLLNMVYDEIKHLIPPSTMPIGAGNCELGEITSWRSSGFKIDTPNEYVRSICEALGMKE